MLVLQSFFLLLLFQSAGEVIRTLGHLPLPGPVIGMVLLAAWYLLRRRAPEPAMEQTAGGLLGWLGLLFVPAGVGIVASFGLVRSAWLPLTIALGGSMLLTLSVTAWTMHRLGRGPRHQRASL